MNNYLSEKNKVRRYKRLDGVKQLSKLYKENVVNKFAQSTTPAFMAKSLELADSDEDEKTQTGS